MKKLKYVAVTLLITILAIIIISIIVTNNKNHEISNVSAETTMKSFEVPDGSSEINEENLEKESFIEDNPELSGAVRTQKRNEEELVSASSQRVYYSQIDSRWKNHPYTSIGDYSQTIGTSGCGPTSASMIVSSIKGVVYPDTMRRFICS